MIGGIPIKRLCFLSIIILFFLTACSTTEGHTPMDNDNQIADKRIEQLLDAIKDKDKETICSMFSKQALDESENLDESIEYLFSFFQGEVISWEKDSGPIVDEITENGKQIKELKTWYNVKTSNQKYIIFMIDYPVNTNEPDNVGLYTLRVVKEEDKETQLGYWQDMKSPGIYNLNNK